MHQQAACQTTDRIYSHSGTPQDRSDTATSPAPTTKAPTASSSPTTSLTRYASYQESFSHIADWIKEVDKYTNPDDTVRMILANKCDVADQRVVTAEEMKVL